jgi:uncharacterized protein (TIGR03437 family)
VFAERRGEHGVKRYAVVLNEAPAAEHPTRSRVAVHIGQQRLKTTIAARGVRVIDSAEVLANAIFVLATPEQAAALKTLAGVDRVEELRPMKLLSAKALDLANVPAAWSFVGGEGNAGVGVKIGLLDTGIDQNHAAFKDDSLRAPAGYPRCRQDNGDCDFTSNKVIVARSYVDMLNFQYGTNPVDTRPDDTSPRDRVGHGTAAAMIAAGLKHDTPAGPMSGVAQKAFLGNYKVFGSPGVNDLTYPDVVIKAMEDALADGMDIITLNLGFPAEWGALDRICGSNRNQPCDVVAEAVDRATRAGLVVVVAAGNDGESGFNYPSLGTINSPGTAPGAITVGAATSSEVWFQSVIPQGPNAPGVINTRFGDGPKLKDPLTAPVRDVRATGDNGKACSPLPNGSLTGAVAIIDRGDCDRPVKVNHAQAAGAVAVILVQFDGSQLVFPMDGLQNTAIPLALIGANDGAALRSWLSLVGDSAQVRLDPQLRSVPARSNLIASFSSQGPAIGDFNIKPEVTGIGTDLYLATQTYDPNGGLYEPLGYAAVNGTSFSTPMVAGAAALYKQRNPSAAVAQVKSAVSNTAATTGLIDFDNSGRESQARARAQGAGRLDANAAARATFTADPATINFGVLGTLVSVSRGLVIRNPNATSLPVNVTVQQRDSDSAASITVAPSNSLSVPPNGQTQFTLRLAGTRPRAGYYEGVLRITANNQEIRVPYHYAVADGVPYNIYPVIGGGFEALTGRTQKLVVKVLDLFGVPVRDVNLRFRAVSGGGRVDTANARTDDYGIGEATVVMSDNPGTHVFAVDAGNLTAEFSGYARVRPAIRNDGVVNAASFDVNPGLAPGSYISIFGTALADTLKSFTTSYLPVSLARVSVSFDNEGQRISVPARIHFVSAGQINVQIPWECQGLASAQMKVSIGDFSSGLITVPLSDVSPGFFTFTDPISGRQLAAALDEFNNLLLTGNSARKGRVIQLYVNGLGPVDSPQKSGEPAPTDRLVRTRFTPEVTVGGRPASVQFSGLAPGFVGLYQVNVVVPADAPSGPQPLQITINGARSKEATLIVE